MRSSRVFKARWTSKRLLLAIIGVAIALRLLGLWMASDLPVRGDEKQYLFVAESIAKTGLPAYPNPQWDEAHSAPAYPYLLAGSYKLVGARAFKSASLLLQIILSVSSVLLVYWIALQAFDRRTALTSAAAVGCFPTLIAYSHYFHSETLYTFLLLGTAALLILARRSARPSTMLIAGFVGGLAALSRSAFVLQIPFVLVWLLWSFRSHRAQSLILLASFLVGVTLSVGPWALHNTLRYDRFLLIDTNGGNVLQKNWNALPQENHDIGLHERRLRLLRDQSIEPRYRPRILLPNLVDQNNAEIRAAIAFTLGHPIVFLRNSGIRAVEFVNPTSFLVRRIRGDDYTAIARWGGELLVIAVVLSSMAAVFFAVPALAARSRNPDQLLLFAFIASHALICVAIVSMSRYRLPIMPFLIIYAAHAAIHFKSYLELRSTWFALAVAVPFLLGSWILYVPHSFP